MYSQTSYQITKIDLIVLRKMKEILSRSSGYAINLEDEMDYFKSYLPTGWFVALDANESIVGFIRSFTQASDWSLSELYVDTNLSERNTLARQLILQFLADNQFNVGHRLRFDINKLDSELNSAVEESGCSQQKQTFLYFEMKIQQSGNEASIVQAATLRQAKEIAEVMSHLHTVAQVEVESWIEDKSIRAIEVDDQVVCVAQVYFYSETAEINRIATRPQNLRQGYARKLLNSICSELIARNIPKLFLKVEDSRIPAIEFYRSYGFKEVESKAQIWHSKWF